MKAIEYSLRYIVLIIVMYYFLLLNNVYTLSFWMIGIIPVNFLAIKYGIYNKINKDNYVTKEYIIFSLIIYTTLFNIIFLLFNKVHYIVIIFTVVINILELIYTENIKNEKK